jgi:hypothetical protein
MDDTHRQRARGSTRCSRRPAPCGRVFDTSSADPGGSTVGASGGGASAGSSAPAGSARSERTGDSRSHPKATVTPKSATRRRPSTSLREPPRQAKTETASRRIRVGRGSAPAVSRLWWREWGWKPRCQRATARKDFAGATGGAGPAPCRPHREYASSSHPCSSASTSPAPAGTRQQPTYCTPASTRCRSLPSSATPTPASP